MVPFKPALLVACASGMIAERARRNGGRGQDSDSDRARFVSEIGHVSHMDPREGSSDWPVPFARQSNELAAYGWAKRVLRDLPRPGDIALEWSEERMTHVYAAIVVDVLEATPERAVCRVYDSTTRSVRGRVVVYQQAKGDRFLRWVDLDQERRWQGGGESLRRAA